LRYVAPPVQMSQSSFGSLIQKEATTVRGIFGYTPLKSGHFLHRHPILVSLQYRVSLIVESLYCLKFYSHVNLISKSCVNFASRTRCNLSWASKRVWLPALSSSGLLSQFDVGLHCCVICYMKQVSDRKMYVYCSNMERSGVIYISNQRDVTVFSFLF
jgi:hypothetical protein